MATIITSKVNESFDCNSKKPKRQAPRITGIESKKENLAASFGGIPKSIDIDIVVPDLDIPGIMAMAWDKPINIEYKYDNDLFWFLKLIDIINIVPVNNKA